jgi:hypothetical protein
MCVCMYEGARGMVGGRQGGGRGLVSKIRQEEPPVGLVTLARRLAEGVGRSVRFLHRVVRKWVGQCGGGWQGSVKSGLGLRLDIW